MLHLEATSKTPQEIAPDDGDQATTYTSQSGPKNLQTLDGTDMGSETKFQNYASHEKLISKSRNVQILNNGLVARHVGPTIEDAFVHSVGEYDRGQHPIRFIMTKNDPGYTFAFGIVSKSKTARTFGQMPPSVYGWNNSGNILHAGVWQGPNDNTQKDMWGKTKFEITLTLDCNKKRIIYMNEQTRFSHDINIDITKCPLPWHLYFYLYDVDDCVQLLA